MQEIVQKELATKVFHYFGSVNILDCKICKEAKKTILIVILIQLSSKLSQNSSWIFLLIFLSQYNEL